MHGLEKRDDLKLLSLIIQLEKEKTQNKPKESR